jgi:WD40 repeat protein/DNA-binding SARP family transcriptional activator
MTALKICLFGALVIALDGDKVANLSSAKACALLAYLSVESSQAHRRDKLVNLLWPEYTETSARANLRRALADLRQAIGDHQAVPPFLHISRETLQFNTTSDAWVDVITFNKLLGTSPPPTTDRELNVTDGIPQLEEAVSLYRGPFLDGFSIPDSVDFEEWALLTRERVHRQCLQALYRLAEAYQVNGEYEAALVHAWRQVEMDPWQESGHRQVMQLLALSGQRGAALAQYEACRKLLRTELGTGPSEQTQQLYNLIRQGEWPSSTAEPKIRLARKVGECPYRGLAAFQEEDASIFFGREKFTDRLSEAVHTPLNATVLVGASGSGKSSVVFAGLLPRIRERENWLITHFRPGVQPFQSLAAGLLPLIEPDLSETDRLIEIPKMALALQNQENFLTDIIQRLMAKHPQASCLFLVVDQFEELYTLSSESEIRQRFLDMLLSSHRDGSESCLKLLLTLRADFLGQALAYRPFADLLQVGTIMLGPMTVDEMRTVVERPAEKRDAAFELGLVDRILDDVGEEPGNLPLLEFALLLLWEKQIDGWLTHEAYEAIEQVEGALTRYADQVYCDLDRPAQEKLQQIFMQLVRPGEGTEDTRRVATRAEIGESNWPLTQLLADKRLVVTSQQPSSGNETAEIAHEALILKWERLCQWIEADRAFRSWQEGLRVGIRQWQDSERDNGALLRGTPLGQAESWLAERGDELSEVEVEYIQASINQREFKEREREAQRQRELTTERRARRLLGALAGVLALAFIVAISLSVYSFRQRQETLQAYSLSMTANARNALDEHDTSSALSLAMIANQIDNPPQEAQRTLLDAAYAPGARWRLDSSMLFPGLKGSVMALDVSPDGRTILSGFNDGTLILWDLNNKEEIFRLQGHTARVNDVDFSPDGLFAISGGDDQQVILWDLTNGQVNKYLEAHTGIVRAVEISPDGRLAVSGGFANDNMYEPGELILWELTSGEEIRRFGGHVSGIVAAKFTPDGQSLLASSGDAEIFSDQLSEEPLDIGTAPFDLILWDIESGKAIQHFKGSQDDAFSLAISPDGTRALASSYYNNLANLWDLENGQLLLTLTGHSEGVHTAGFSADGLRALTGSYDDSLILWDLLTGKPEFVLKAHNSDVLDLVLNPDGQTALSSAGDGGLILWDLYDTAEVQRLAGHGDMVYDVAFTPDGKRAISASGASAPSVPVKDASIRLWDLETGEQIKSQELPLNAIFQVAISSDGQTALLATDHPYIIVWDLFSWREIGRLEGHRSAVTSVEIDPDGQRALSLGVDGTLILWDMIHRRAILSINVPDQGDQGLWALAVSPDGRSALTDSRDSSMILWDLETGKELRNFVRNDPPDEPGSSGMAFLPDGRSAISCEPDGYLIEWDLESGEEIRRLGLHPSLRTRVVVSDDGNLALTSGMDGSIMLWNLKTSDLVRRSSGHGIIFDIALSPDNLTALFGTSDTMIYHWLLSNPTLDELREWIQSNRYVRDLSCEEQNLYQIKPDGSEACPE